MKKEDQVAFLDAVKNLDDKQKLTLYNFSANLLEGSGYSSGMDLLYEVIDRVLSGSRAWRQEIPIGAFLHEAMRSVASVNRRCADQRPLSFEDWMEVGVESNREPDDEFALSPEEMLMKRQEEEIRRETLDAAKVKLGHNKHALALFRGLAEHMTPAEIRKEYGMSESNYKAARARIAKEIRSQGLARRS